MTIRHYLQRQKRWSFAGVYLGIAASAMLALTVRVCCPQCRSRLGEILSNVGGPVTIPRRLRFCPFGGVALDAPMPSGRPE